jgi:hypothetical protein
MIRSMRILTLLVCGVMLSSVRAANEISVTIDDLMESKKTLVTIGHGMFQASNPSQGELKLEDKEFADVMYSNALELNDFCGWLIGMLKILDVIRDSSEKAEASKICAEYAKELERKFEAPVFIWDVGVNQGDQHPATITILASKLVDECRRMQAILKPVP